MKRFYFWNTAIPLAVGSLIYVMFRPSSLVVFDWARLMGLSTSVEALRSYVQAFRHLVPDWVVFALPDGLWTYAMVAYFLYLWRGASTRPGRVSWAFGAVAIAITSELLQGARLLPGVFDAADLVLYIVGAVVAALVAFGIPAVTHESTRFLENG